MFGTTPRAVRPVLLLVVYGAFLAVVGVTATAQVALVSLHFSSAALRASIGSDAAIVRTFANQSLTTRDLTERPVPGRVAPLEATLTALATEAGILRVDILDVAGIVRLSTEPDTRGSSAAGTPAFTGALAGGYDTVVGDAPPTGGSGQAVPEALRVAFPLVDGDRRPQAVVMLWRDAATVFSPLGSVQRDTLIVTLAAAAIAGVLLYLVFRSAQDRIRRQTEQLLESTRRDPSTGLLNHGALVGELALAVEAARRDGTSVAVALVDIDNFRLLNDTHGHEAGDGVLARVAEALAARTPPSGLVGRYGPDEFLLIVPAAQIAELEPALEDLRAALADQAVDIPAAERLPMTVSAAIATFPADAESVTELLSTVALTLSEAKASGGDATRVTGTRAEPDADSRTFNVLQGLVFAIDTKDRYTKRHSEDVARYGVFLARRLGLEPGVIEAVRTAGLLHDVGKIGIPDDILRKPGKLTASEYDIVKQHVALGDSIVRDLVDIDLVRAGIRHHHERWDGTGYLHALAGEDIPIVGRILAVGDAFSAMTTTRPYRKALSVEEALRRLGDAAGSQLEEGLVAAFIDGIELAADAPLPGRRTDIALWLPAQRVA